MNGLTEFLINVAGGVIGASGVVAYLFFRLEYLGKRIKKLTEEVERLEFQVRVLQAQCYIPDYKDE